MRNVARHSRLIRWARRFATVMISLGAGSFLLGLVLLAGLRLQTVRGFAVAQVNKALDGLFLGRLHIESVARLGLSGAQGVNATMFDVERHAVIVVRGASAQIAVMPLLWALVAHPRSPLSIDLAQVTVDHVEARLIDAGQGVPTLGVAFYPSHPGTGTTSAAIPIIHLRSITVEHAWVHGQLAAAPGIDADIAHASARLDIVASRLRLQVNRASVRARGVHDGVNLAGDIGGIMDLRIAEPPPSEIDAASLAQSRGHSAHAWYSGELAGSRVATTFDWADGKFSASLDSPRIEPTSVASIAPGIALPHPLALHAKAEGALSAIDFEVRTRLADGSSGAASPAPNSTTLVVVGRADLGDDTKIDAEIRAEKLNAADLRAGAPESRLDGVGHVQFTRTQRATISGRYDLTTWPGLISATPVPAIDLEGSLNQDPAGAFTTTGRAHVLEPGADTTVQYSAKLLPKSKGSVVSIESTTEVSNPSRLRTLADGLLVQGSLEVNARYWPDDGDWSAHSQASLHDVRHARLSAGGIELRAEASGGHVVASGAVHLRARDIETAGQVFRTLDLDADGTLTGIRLAVHMQRADAQLVNLTTELGLRPSLRAQHSRIDLPSNKDSIAFSIDDIHMSGGTTHIDGLHVQGAGTADASLTIGRELEQLSVSTESFDWARVARLSGFPSPVRSMKTTLVARYASQGAASEGTVRGHASRMDFGPYRDASAEVNLTLARGLVNGTLASQLAPGNSLNISVQALPIDQIERPDRLLDSHDFSLSLRASLDLAALKAWLRSLDVPLEQVSGKVLLDLTAMGPSDGRERPELSARVETRSLQLVGLSDAQTPIGTPAVTQGVRAWSLQDIDGKIFLTVTGVRPLAAASFQLFDKHGTLITARASAELPASTWRTLRLAASDAWAMPLVAHLSMVRRSLKKLPPIFRTQSLRGTASVEADLAGTLANPQVVINAEVQSLSAMADLRARHEKLGLDVSFHADGSRSDGNLRADAKQGRPTVGSLQANWHGDVVRLASANFDDPSPLLGDLLVQLDRFPLGVLPPLSDRQMSGALTGNIALRNWGRNATFVAKLNSDRLEIGSVVIEKSLLRVTGGDGQIVAKAGISGTNSGKLNANVTSKMIWGDRLAPSVDPGVHGAIRAKGFQLAIVSPFLRSSVNELAGAIDAKLDVTLDKGTPRLEGQAALSNGVIQVPSIGQRFDSIQATATVHDGTLSIEGMQARGLTGRLTGTGKLKLDGLSLRSGDVYLAVAHNEQIPITVEGQAMGDAWGRVEVKLKRFAGQNTTNIRVDLPELHFALPDVDPKNLQALELAEHVRIGAHRSDGEFIFLPVQPLATHAQSGNEALVVDVHLGSSVWIQKGTDIKVQIAGDLLARLSDKTTLEGRLDLKGGRLDVSGKTFEIERGVVIFDGGDASNPSITATARWDSPAGYSVYADYIGSVKNGKLTLRSEPALSPDKVLGLLMFGTPDGALGAGEQQSQGSESASAAVGVAGETAVKGLNRAITGVTKPDVSARLDTSTGTARPELDVQITPRVTARMTRAIGEPAVGQSPDRTFLTFELRLLRAWSLSAVVGDHGGSGLDLLWRRRY